MQSLKFTATSSDKEWIEGNKNRETYREHKEEICDRTESRNEDKEDFFFLTQVRGARIWGATSVKDEKNLSRRVENFIRKIGVSADVSSPEKITFTDWKQRLKTPILVIISKTTTESLSLNTNVKASGEKAPQHIRLKIRFVHSRGSTKPDTGARHMKISSPTGRQSS